MLFVVLIPILAFLMIKDGATMRERYLQWAAGRAHARSGATWSTTST